MGKKFKKILQQLEKIISSLVSFSLPRPPKKSHSKKEASLFFFRSFPLKRQQQKTCPSRAAKKLVQMFLGTNKKIWKDSELRLTGANEVLQNCFIGTEWVAWEIKLNLNCWRKGRRGSSSAGTLGIVVGKLRGFLLGNEVYLSLRLIDGESFGPIHSFRVLIGSSGLTLWVFPLVTNERFSLRRQFLIG